MNKVVGIIRDEGKWGRFIDAVGLAIFLFYLVYLFAFSNVEFKQGLIDLICFGVANMLFTLIHEWSHYLPAQILGYKPFLDLRIWEKASCHFQGYIKKHHFILIAVMPAIVVIMTYFIIRGAIPNATFVLPLVLIQLTACRGDFELVSKALLFKGSHFFRENEEKLGEFVVYNNRR